VKSSMLKRRLNMQKRNVQIALKGNAVLHASRNAIKWHVIKAK